MSEEATERPDATVTELAPYQWYGVPAELLEVGAAYDWDSPGGCG